MLNTISKYPAICCIVLFVLAELVINPIGNFPLNDDWAFSRAIYNYLHTGVFKLSDWQSLPLIPQLFTGIAVTKVFGFSFTTLRFISLFSTLLLIIIFNMLLKEFEVLPPLRLITLLCLTFNPLTISLSNTFLPDIFTLLLVLSAFLFAVKTIKSFSPQNFLLFIFLSLLATINRQTSLVIPIAFGVIYIILSNKKTRAIITGLTPLLVCIIAVIALPLLITNLPTNYQLQLPHIISSVLHPNTSIIKSFGYYLTTSTVMMGLFIAPLTLCNIKQHLAIIQKSIWLKVALGLYILIILTKLIAFKNYLPFTGNMFYPFGVGPIIMTGLDTQTLHPTSLLAIIFWSTLNILGGLSFYSTLVSIFSSRNKNIITSYSFFTILAIYLMPLCLSYVNDRYLLLLLPFLIIAYIPSVDFKLNRFILAPSLTILLAFSIVTTHDYLSINRARWQATDELVNNMHVSPKSIDGGFEFNGWYSEGFKNYNPLHTGRWWWVEDDTYIISPSLITGYTIQAITPFSTWLSFKFNNIYTLKRAADN